jgi:hypothetical protein
MSVKQDDAVLQRPRSGRPSRFRRPGGERPPERPLVGRGFKKALAITVVLVLIAVGLRFAWDQLRETPVGRAVEALQQAAGDLFTSEDILRSGEMITGALIREQYLPADGRGYTHRVSYTDRDSWASWTQWATFDAIVGTAVDTRDLSEGAVSPRWEDPSEIVYVITLPQPQLREPFWVSEPRDLDVDCNAVEAVWRFITVAPTACADDGVHADPLLRWKAETDFKASALADHELFDMGRRDVEDYVEGMAAAFIDPLASRYDFTYSFEFVWQAPTR